jgi:hypothetical protein
VLVARVVRCIFLGRSEAKGLCDTAHHLVHLQTSHWALFCRRHTGPFSFDGGSLVSVCIIISVMS